MAKARIVGALGLAGRVYTAGEEDALRGAAKAAKLDLKPFTEEGGPLEGDWSTASTPKAPPASNAGAGEFAMLEGVDFASAAAYEAAQAAELTSEDFKGVRPSSEGGYTKPDVQSVIDGRDK